MDNLIRILNTFNAKEEELTILKLEGDNFGNAAINKRVSRMNKKINSALADAWKLIKEIDPVIVLMSLYRNLGIFSFYLILVSSGLYFSFNLHCLF